MGVQSFLCCTLMTNGFGFWTRIQCPVAVPAGCGRDAFRRVLTTCTCDAGSTPFWTHARRFEYVAFKHAFLAIALVRRKIDHGSIDQKGHFVGPKHVARDEPRQLRAMYSIFGELRTVPLMCAIKCLMNLEKKKNVFGNSSRSIRVKYCGRFCNQYPSNIRTYREIVKFDWRAT